MSGEEIQDLITRFDNKKQWGLAWISMTSRKMGSGAEKAPPVKAPMTTAVPTSGRTISRLAMMPKITLTGTGAAPGPVEVWS